MNEKVGAKLLKSMIFSYIWGKPILVRMIWIPSLMALELTHVGQKAYWPGYSAAFSKSRNILVFLKTVLNLKHLNSDIHL